MFKNEMLTRSPRRARKVGPGLMAVGAGGVLVAASHPWNCRKFSVPTLGMVNLPLTMRTTACSARSFSRERTSGGLAKSGLPSCAGAGTAGSSEHARATAAARVRGDLALAFTRVAPFDAGRALRGDDHGVLSLLQISPHVVVHGEGERVRAHDGGGPAHVDALLVLGQLQPGSDAVPPLDHPIAGIRDLVELTADRVRWLPSEDHLLSGDRTIDRRGLQRRQRGA